MFSFFSTCIVDISGFPHAVVKIILVQSVSGHTILDSQEHREK